MQEEERGGEEGEEDMPISTALLLAPRHFDRSTGKRRRNDSPLTLPMSVGRHYPSNNRKQTLRIYQANIGKVPEAHDIALALADTEKFDIVLLQEPWTKWVSRPNMRPA